MDRLKDPRIQSLMTRAGSSGELCVPLEEGQFRIDLKPDNIELWQDTLDRQQSPCTLLLACEKGDGPLRDTSLTWVVGSAIRAVEVRGQAKVEHLLQELKVPQALAAAAREHCFGLGDGVIWAFYLERHGWLTASPVACQ